MLPRRRNFSSCPLARLFRMLFWGCVSALLTVLVNTLGLCSCNVAFPIIWLLTAGTYLALASMKLPSLGKAVLVTGCDTGFGHHLALHLDKLGFRVFAGCLHCEGAGAKRLRREGSGRLHVLQLDVTSQKQIAKALQDVKHFLNSGEVLWGLVNNAGISTYGAVEWVSMDTYRKLSEVNLFGPIAVTKAFLPLIRKVKGRVVTVASVRGRMSSPMGTAYEVTKYGVEAFNDGLRNEMRRFGVDVCLIEPGNFTVGTGIYSAESVQRDGQAMWVAMDQQVKDDYGKDYIERIQQSQLKDTRSGNPDVSEVVDALTDALTQRFPQSRYQPMDLDYYVRVFVNQHFPEWVYDYLIIEFLRKFGW
ncbi:D-beta-hydroxybutyrate dehydrogenase, mitochondrial-like isoform X2 [Panulirus ornatus]|uniref:D-beta-hydroxybutyrate dehydrogenase, mitochondrial-like isoform X2 n=1 Tax=Panulirus ornatus TaxID=150431 RepID=UPI003A83F80F